MCGITSRRKAEKLILEGKVKVNGKTVKELSFKVDLKKDRVEVNGKLIRPQRKVYIILNKPPLYLTSLKDEGDKRSIIHLLRGVKERVFPVGRLDYNSEGLLLLTNDGELAHRVLHPSYKLPKTYLVLVEGKITKAKLERIRRGALLEDGFAHPEEVLIRKTYNSKTLLEITFTEGRKHLVKRYLGHFGHKVLRLKRIRIGPISLGNLKRGQLRYLTREEVRLLKESVGL